MNKNKETYRKNIKVKVLSGNRHKRASETKQDKYKSSSNTRKETSCNLWYEFYTPTIQFLFSSDLDSSNCHDKMP